jgi:hypothetical protein
VGIALAIGASYFMVMYYHSLWFALLGLAGAASSALQSACSTTPRPVTSRGSAAGTWSARRCGRGGPKPEAARAAGRWGDVFLFSVYERYSRFSMRHCASTR